MAKVVTKQQFVQGMSHMRTASIADSDSQAGVRHCLCKRKRLFKTFKIHSLLQSLNNLARFIKLATVILRNCWA